eukprot:m.57520 g.57520  ORF g.57520 m.57520 type:complete len:145 (-) comp15608_c0_seq2:2288-2722(-)
MFSYFFFPNENSPRFFFFLSSFAVSADEGSAGAEGSAVRRCSGWAGRDCSLIRMQNPCLGNPPSLAAYAAATREGLQNNRLRMGHWSYECRHTRTVTEVYCNAGATRVFPAPNPCVHSVCVTLCLHARHGGLVQLLVCIYSGGN